MAEEPIKISVGIEADKGSINGLRSEVEGVVAKPVSAKVELNKASVAATKNAFLNLAESLKVNDIFSKETLRNAETFLTQITEYFHPLDTQGVIKHLASSVKPESLTLPKNTGDVRFLQQQLSDASAAANSARQELTALFMGTMNNAEAAKVDLNEFLSLIKKLAESNMSVDFFKNALANPLPVEEIKQGNDSLYQAVAHMNLLKKNLKDMESGKVPFTDAGWIEANTELQLAIDKVNELKDSLLGVGEAVPEDIVPNVVEPEVAPTDTVTTDTEVVAPVDEQAISLVEQYKEAIIRLGQALGNAENYATIARMALGGVGTVLQGLGTVLQGTVIVAANGFKAAMSGVASVSRQVWSASQQLVVTLGTKLKNAFNNAGKSAQSSVKKFLMVALGVRGIMAAVRRMRTAVIQAFKDMAAGSEEINAELSSVSTSFAQLKGSIAVAFQPIVSAAVPYINALCAALNQAINTLATFFATLTGQGFVYQFTAANKDLAKSVKGAGGAAKEAKKTLMGFDELNLLNGKNDGGGGGGGADTNGIYEKMPLEDVSNYFAEMVQKAWENSDFTAVGMEISRTLIAGMQSIQWFDIQQMAGTLGTDLATLLNGIIADIGGTNLFSEIGNTIAQGLNTVVTFLYNFVTKFNWGQFGKALADGIMRFVKEVDWNKMGGTISGIIQGVLSTLSEFLLNIDFGEIVDAFIEFIYGVDWVGIGAALVVTLGSLAVAIIEGVGALLQAPFDAIAKGFELCGMDTIAGFFYGISDKLQKGVDTVVGFFKTYIIEPFKDLMGIHSPSTLFAELGGYLIEGLIDGIKGLIDKVVQIWTDLKSSTEEKFNAIKSKVVEIATNIKNNLTGKFGEVKTNVVDKFNALKTKVISVFNELKDNIKAPINAIIGFIESLVNGVINGINKMTSALNTLQIDIPSGPWGGGGSIGFNIPAIPTVSIPRLAQGGVIPPNQEFLAMLGDQKHGTNVEAPLETIKQAVAEVLDEQIDALGIMTDAIIEAIQNKNLSVIIGDRDVGEAANRYNNRQKALRGM